MSRGLCLGEFSEGDTSSQENIRREYLRKIVWVECSDLTAGLQVSTRSGYDWPLRFAHVHKDTACDPLYTISSAAKLKTRIFFIAVIRHKTKYFILKEFILYFVFYSDNHILM